MSAVKKILCSTAFQVAGKIMTVALSLVLLSLLARYFSPTQLADYATVYSLLAVFAALADMGIYTMVLKEMNTKTYHNGIVLRAVLSLFILGLASVVLFFSPLYADTLVSFGFFIAAFGTFFTLMTGIVSAVLQYYFAMQYAVFSLFIGKLISFCLILLTIIFFFPPSSESFFLIVFFAAFGSFVTLLGTVFFARRFLFSSHFFSNITLLSLRNIFFKTLPFGISALLAMLYFQSGMLSFRFLLPPLDAAFAESHYFLLVRIFEVLLTFPVYFMASFLPHLQNDFSKNFSLGFLFLFLLAFPFAVYLFIATPSVLQLLAPAYLATENALKLASVSLFFAFLNIFITYSLIALGKVKRVLFRNFIALVLCLVLLFFFVPAFSFLGAAMATLVTEIFIFFWGMRALLHFQYFVLPWRQMYHIMLASFFAVLVFWSLHWGFATTIDVFFLLPLASIVSAFVFVFLLFKIGFFTPELKKIFSK